MINGHFVDDSFLIVREDEQSISTTLNYLDIFCKALGSSIQWKKTSCYRKLVHEPPNWLQNYQWKWINAGEVFKFISIPFSFYGHPTQLCIYVVQKVESNLDYWLSKKLSLVGKFQICSKVLVATHVYYSSCWVPSQACYNKLEKLLWDFLWCNSFDKKGFHKVAWEFFSLLREVGGMGILDCKCQCISLYAK